MKYRNYTDEDIITYAAEVKSMAGLLNKLGLKSAGGNYVNMQRNLQRLNIDCSHWTGALWSKDKRLKDWANYTQSTQIKKHLINFRGNNCEICKLSEWLGEIIKLEIHHIDGDRTNNAESNLQLLCPNCHSYTETWRKRK